MKKSLFLSGTTGILALLFIFLTGFEGNETQKSKAAIGGEMSFTVRTVPAGGNFAPKHVLAIWVEDADGFVKTRKAMANQRKQYLYTWHAASNYNVVDAITGSTLTSHQTHTITWNCKDLDGNIVPDGDYTIWVEFTDQHAQGPLYTLTFTKGPDPISLTPSDETYFKDLTFEFTPIIADFSYDVSEICQWETITFTDESTNAQSYAWDFGEGAAPATANTAGPHTVYYTMPGIKTVSLTVNGSLTETKEDIIQVNAKPEAEFEFGGMSMTVQFTNTSLNSDSFLWNFGDGETSIDENPLHTYTDAGAYNVSLTANNLNCSGMISHEVMVPLVSIDQNQENSQLKVFPNPANNVISIFVPENIRNKSTLFIYNSMGSLVKEISVRNSSAGQYLMLDIADQPRGMYMLNLKSDSNNLCTKVLLK